MARYTLWNKVYQWLAAGLWFSPDTLIFSIDRNIYHNLRKWNIVQVVLNTNNPKKYFDLNFYVIDIVDSKWCLPLSV